MKRPALIMCLLSCLAGTQFSANAQQLQYTAAEAYAIHDSINSSRWDTGGRLSHYSFRFMSEFFPVAIIDNQPLAYRFGEKPLQVIEDIQVPVGKERLRFEQYLERLHINALIVVHKGEVVYEKYFSMLPHELHTLQSCTKVITSTLIAQLINEQKINSQLPVETYLPALINTAWAGTSVKDVLDMRSGMEGSEMSNNMTGFTDPQHPYYVFEEALGILPKADTVASSVHQHVASMKRRMAAGQEPEYHSMNTFILGWIAESVTGKSYAALVSERIWKPMGASSNAYVCISDKGVPWTHGGISATLRDFARFGMLYTKSEMRANKEKNISFAQLREIFETPVLDLGFMKFQGGYQWDWARDGMLMKGGFGGQALLVDHERDLVIAYFNHIDKDWQADTMLSFKAIEEIRKAVDASKKPSN